MEAQDNNTTTTTPPEQPTAQPNPPIVIPNNESKGQGSGSPYPAETLLKSLEVVKEIIQKNGTANPITKDKIAVSLGKAQTTLTLSFSTWGQYSIFTNHHGKGYLPSALYNEYIDHAYPEDERKALLKMFKSVPLYSKLITNLNNQVLPPEDKFPNLLKSDTYKINPNSAERASRVFFENARFLKIIDANNRFRFLIPEGNNTTPPPNENQGNNENSQQSTPPTPPSEEGLFRLPIPLESKMKAYFSYPLEGMTAKDIKVIIKAIEFIALSAGIEMEDVGRKENRNDS